MPGQSCKWPLGDWPWVVPDVHEVDSWCRRIDRRLWTPCDISMMNSREHQMLPRNYRLCIRRASTLYYVSREVSIMITMYYLHKIHSYSIGRGTQFLGVTKSIINHSISTFQSHPPDGRKEFHERKFFHVESFVFFWMRYYLEWIFFSLVGVVSSSFSLSWTTIKVEITVQKAMKRRISTTIIIG